jgi:hypothetical protein
MREDDLGVLEHLSASLIPPQFFKMSEYDTVLPEYYMAMKNCTAQSVTSFYEEKKTLNDVNGGTQHCKHRDISNNNKSNQKEKMTSTVQPVAPGLLLKNI